MLKIKQFAFNDFGENTYVLFDTDSREALVVDPGMADDKERQFFDKFIENNGLTITNVVNTHLHLDHCFGDNYVVDRYGVKVAASIADAPLGRTVGQQAQAFGVRMGREARGVEIDVPLKDGDEITLGKYRLTVLEVPGHSPGGLVLYCAEGKFAFVGDSIFYGSIGRTDLPGGCQTQLVDALKNKVLTLPDNTQLLPGHGPITTVAREKVVNPFIR